MRKRNKKMLSKQREYMKSYIDDYTKRIDNILINHSEEIKEDTFQIQKIQSAKF